MDLSKYKFLNSGRNRDVYLCPSGRYVIKIPRNDVGVINNHSEHERYRHERSFWYPLARCRLVHNTDILIMQYVEHERWTESMPSWVGFVDCQQVGYNRLGQLVAYDYAQKD